MNQLTKIVANYECVASEYYDSNLHPTCANFAELSRLFLAPRIKKYVNFSKQVLEVGAGRSIAALELEKISFPLGKLTLLDQSIGMLEYSREWVNKGANLRAANACVTGLPSHSFHLVVSSLGDPYNFPQFWIEIKRLLAKGGICLFTIPAPEWASRFRVGADPALAEFALKSGARVFVPSLIPEPKRQAEMIYSAGLQIDEIFDLDASYLSTPLSAKLQVDSSTAALPIVRGFTIGV